MISSVAAPADCAKVAVPIAAGPHRVGKPLKLGLEGLHSARRGDYGVIYRIDERRRRVDVLAVEHRSDIYRQRQV